MAPHQAGISLKTTGKQDSPTLELSTVRSHQKIKIDGKEYEINDWDELDLPVFLRVRSVLARLNPGNNTDALTEEEASETGATIEKLVRFLLFDTPDDVFAKLNTIHKMQILGVARIGAEDFFRRLAEKEENRISSSRVSRGSTAARPKTGKR